MVACASKSHSSEPRPMEINANFIILALFALGLLVDIVAV